MPFNPDTRHPLYAKWLPTWRKMRDCYDGDDAIKDRGEEYLPMPSGMSAAPDPQAAYRAYQTRAQPPELMEPAVRGMSGVIHRKPSTYELPTGLKGVIERATKDKQTLDAFHRRITREVLKVGRFGVLVDAPKDGGEPFLAGYTAESIVDWDVDDDGRLIYLVLDESTERRDPASGTWKDVGRWRVCEMKDGAYTVTVHERGENGAVTTEDPINPQSSRNAPLTEIPFVFVGATDLTPDPDEAPLEGVAKAQLSIYRLDADRRQSLFLTSQPTPVAIGFENTDDAPTFIGSSAIWVIPPGGDAKMLEFTGSGIGAIKQAMDDDFERAVASGARLIVADRQGGVESGEALAIRTASQTATLTGISQNVGAGLERVLRFAAMMTGGNENAVTVTPNTDFVEAHLSPTDINGLVEGWLKGAYSKLTLFENLQRGGIVSDSRTFEDEEELIARDAPDLTPPITDDEADEDEIDDATGAGEDDEDEAA